MTDLETFKKMNSSEHDNEISKCFTDDVHPNPVVRSVHHRTLGPKFYG